MKMFAASAILALAIIVPAMADPKPPAKEESGIEGVIAIGPTRGGPVHEGVPSSQGLANMEFVVSKEKNETASFTTDKEGKFRINLSPGHYIISLKRRGPAIGRFGPFEADVAAGKMTKVTWQCDSGMR